MSIYSSVLLFKFVNAQSKHITTYLNDNSWRLRTTDVFTDSAHHCTTRICPANCTGLGAQIVDINYRLEMRQESRL